jgi:hypothetical protein
MAVSYALSCAELFHLLLAHVWLCYVGAGLRAGARVDDWIAVAYVFAV